MHHVLSTRLSEKRNKSMFQADCPELTSCFARMMRHGEIMWQFPLYVKSEEC